MFGKRVECLLGSLLPLVGAVLKTGTCVPPLALELVLTAARGSNKTLLLMEETLDISTKEQGCVCVFFFM